MNQATQQSTYYVDSICFALPLAFNLHLMIEYEKQAVLLRALFILAKRLEAIYAYSSTFRICGTFMRC